jgi:TetR/AcrR family transcriptional regulator of autoinduction and epiphytic fitness
VLVNITSPRPADVDLRLCAVLDAAIGVFARFGYRKTSMDDVARAAGVSRQGLYLSFANKEELFRRALEHSLRAQLASAIAALSGANDSLEIRIIAACKEWSGRFVGSLGADAADLMCASTSLAGATLAEYEWQFEAALADAIRATAVADRCAAAGLNVADFARALHATARGLKQTCKTQEAFVKGMTAAVRMACMPSNRPREIKRFVP